VFNTLFLDALGEDRVGTEEGVLRPFSFILCTRNSSGTLGSILI
jgi:hypothetical protein